MRTGRLETLIWALIYGGLLAVCLGLFMKEADTGLGWGAIVLGAIATTVGALLIYARSTRD